MRVLIPSLLLIILVCGPCSAQNEVFVAYPLDTLHSVFGHWNPFGSLSTGSADECREQLLIPAAYLPPTGGTITAIEVSPHVTGVTPFKSLVISMGHSTVPTLSFTFAANLPKPWLVYSLTNQSMNWGSNKSWFRIKLQAFFRYDGKSNLIIEFQKILDRPNNPNLGTLSHQYTIAPYRRDLPLAVWANGSYGSGAATATTATYRYNAGPLLIRVIFAATRTLTIQGSRGGGKAYFHLGSTAVLTVRALPGEVYFNGLDFSLRASGLQVPGIQGVWWLPGIFNLFWTGFVNAQGEGTFHLPIPNVPVLIGTHAYFQSATAGTSVNFTNVVDAIVAQ